MHRFENKIREIITIELGKENIIILKNEIVHEELKFTQVRLLFIMGLNTYIGDFYFFFDSQAIRVDYQLTRLKNKIFT